MTEKEMHIWQYADESRDRIEALEKKVEGMEQAWIVFMKLMAEHLEKENGK